MLPGTRKRMLLLLASAFIFLAVAWLNRGNWGRVFTDPQYAFAQGVPEQPDSMEYVPGFQKNPMSVQKQFERYPSPQFRSGHSLMPNMLWMDPAYFSGWGQDGVSKTSAVENSIFLQDELSSNWNYYLLVSANTTLFNRYENPGSFESEWIKLAQKHPERKCAAISFWAQLRPEHLSDSSCYSKRAFAMRKDLPDSMYVTEDINGKIYKRWNPANDATNLHCDYKTQKFYFEKLHQHLNRPLDFINENAEVFHHFQDEQMSENPRVKKDMLKLGITDPEKYQTVKRLEAECAYRDSVLGVKGNEKAVYTVYSIDGQNKYRHRYDLMRKLATPIRGMHYATPDFYPRWPDNWSLWKGPWHGLEWIVRCRNTEIKYGDRLFSPYVAAGWDNDETKNIRPAQWLGLMKILGVMGAEFFYTGFFNLKKPYADPRGYAWQSVIPVYAQAALSHAEDILLEGELLNSPEYLLETGSKEFVAVARKHPKKQHYLLATAIMVNSNEKSERPGPAYVEVLLDGMKVRVESRRQGSLYRIEKNAGGDIRIVQLDHWHEDSHPARWSLDLRMGAGNWEIPEAESETDKNGELIVVLNPGQKMRKEIQMNREESFSKFELYLKESAPVELEVLINGKTFPLKGSGGLAVLKNKLEIIKGRNTFEILCKKGRLKLTEVRLMHE